MSVSCRERRQTLILVLGLGVLITLWRLGATGVVDETPPLFAAAGRAMAETGDWLTPQVNGLPRYDKPPLVYWLMGLGYSLPGGDFWDPLGSWAARLPSAFASIAMMLVLTDTFLRWPQEKDIRPRSTSVITALAFALSPLVLVWSRTAVSDALLCGSLGISLLLQWRRFADPTCIAWWPAWTVLGLAVLVKGPVSVVISGLALLLFGALRHDLRTAWTRLRPVQGILVTTLISLPWYGLELLVEGQAFWDSFFGYHNIQRFTSVVNDHLQPWWFFGPVMVVAALPLTPFLILGLVQVPRQRVPPEQSLQQFAACWLVAVFLLFTVAATKLPSYWLPATPAAALLTGFATTGRNRLQIWAWIISLGLVVLLAICFWLAPAWVGWINDPEMPTLAVDLLASGLVRRTALWFSLAAILGLIALVLREPAVVGLLGIQVPLLLFHITALIPIAELADRLRQAPVRQIAAQMRQQYRKGEPLAMVGVIKPSLHFHTGQIILFEGRSDRALVNLADRLANERRRGWVGYSLEGNEAPDTVLIAIDSDTSKQEYWRDLDPIHLGKYGIYNLWRLDRQRLEKRADVLKADGVEADWRQPRQERF
ncbi:glycosyltransferase family 39 protein [Synechococcus sp. M16CYN]|uniref:ArnT family glycosyltransferase n=1 Tax=Synechococcus sp. M16CYN TaxID=3103139 RepID=UPI0030E2CA6D